MVPLSQLSKPRRLAGPTRAAYATAGAVCVRCSHNLGGLTNRVARGLNRLHEATHMARVLAARRGFAADAGDAMPGYRQGRARAGSRGGRYVDVWGQHGTRRCFADTDWLAAHLHRRYSEASRTEQEHADFVRSTLQSTLAHYKSSRYGILPLLLSLMDSPNMLAQLEVRSLTQLEQLRSSSCNHPTHRAMSTHRCAKRSPTWQPFDATSVLLYAIASTCL